MSDSQFLQRVENSGLTQDTIVSIRESVSADMSDEQMAEHLTRQSVVTSYQAEALLGKHNSPLVIGDYEISDQIGRGGMGYVLKARHRKMDRDVAIKFILPNYLDSDDVRQRFEREVKAAAKLEHPNIITAYDAGSLDDGSHYLVMRYVDGKDLSTRVREEAPLSVSAAIDVICQSARGLAYAHEQGIVHRDIKPANLLLDRKGRVRILDMGLARMRPSPGDDDPDALTNTGSMMGTVDYMAPEQAMDARSADHRADIYSLGCTLYFLLTGRAPYASESMMSRLLAHREGPVPFLGAFYPGVPDELEAVYQRAMAKDRKQRFQSMEELIDALTKVEVDEESDTSSLATVEMPDDGNGGFIQVPDHSETQFEPASDAGNASGTSSEETRATSNQSDQANNGLRPTIPETTSPVTTALPDDTDPRTAVETFIETLSEASGSHSESPARSTPKTVWILGVVVVAALAAIVPGMLGREPAPVETPGPTASPLATQSGNETVVPSNDNGVTEKSEANFELEFDGESGVIVPDFKLDNFDQFTFEATITADEHSTQGNVLIDWHAKVGLHTDEAGRLFGKIWVPVANKGVTVGSTPLSIGKHHRVALVLDEESLTLFVNGVRSNSKPIGDFRIDPSALDLGFGQRCIGGQPPLHFSGRIDEVRISNTARYTDNYELESRFETDEHTVALYHFDEGGGDVAKDSSGNGFHGEIFGAKWVTPGESRQDQHLHSSETTKGFALEFNGHSAVLPPPLALKDVGQFTIEARVALPPEGTHGDILFWHNNINLGVENARIVRGKIHRPGKDRPARVASHQPNTGEYQTVAMVFDGETLSLFIDGTLCESDSIEDIRPGLKIAQMAIGGYISSPALELSDNQFRGRIDEFRLSTTARYEKDYTPSIRLDADDQTLLLYHFDEGQGDVLIDSSGNGHHGKIVGAKWVMSGQTFQAHPIDEVSQPDAHADLDADSVASGLIPRPMRIRGIRRWQLDTVLPRLTEYQQPCCFVSESNQIALASGQEVRIYDVADAEISSILKGHDGPIHSLSWNEKEELLASGAHKNVAIWAVNTSNLVTMYPAATRGVHRVAWSPDGSLLATGGHWPDRTLSVWRLNGELIWQKKFHGPVNDLSWDEDSRRFAVAGDKIQFLVYSAIDGVFVDHRPDLAPVSRVVWSRDSKWVAVDITGIPTVLKILETDAWSEVADLRPPAASQGSFSTGLAWSPDSRLLAETNQDGRIRIWDPFTKEILHNHYFHRQGEGGATTTSHFPSWSDNGELLATTSPNKLTHLCIYDTTKRQVHLSLAAPSLEKSLHKDGHIILKTAEGESLEFRDSGELLNGNPEVLDEHLVYWVEQLDGTQHLMKHAEFLRLAESSKRAE